MGSKVDELIGLLDDSLKTVRQSKDEIGLLIKGLEDTRRRLKEQFALLEQVKTLDIAKRLGVVNVVAQATELMADLMKEETPVKEKMTAEKVNGLIDLIYQLAVARNTRPLPLWLDKFFRSPKLRREIGSYLGEISEGEEPAEERVEEPQVFRRVPVQEDVGEEKPPDDEGTVFGKPAREVNITPEGRIIVTLRAKRPPEPKKELKPFGLHTKGVRILRHAFANNYYPATLEEALARSYGDDWASQLLTKLSHKKPVRTTIGEDIKQKDSFIINVVRKTVQMLNKVKKGIPPNERQPNKKVHDTYLVLGFDQDERWAIIMAAVNQWGINIQV